MYLVICCQGALWQCRQAVCVASTLRLIKRGRCVMANHQSGRFSIQEAFHPLQSSFILLDTTSVAQAARRALSPAKWGDIDLLLSAQTDQRLLFCLCVFVSFLVLCTFLETPAQFALWGNFGPLAWRENAAIAKEGVISELLYNPSSYKEKPLPPPKRPLFP